MSQKFFACYLTLNQPYEPVLVVVIVTIVVMIIPCRFCLFQIRILLEVMSIT